MPRKKITEPEELEQSAVLEQPAGEDTDAAAGEGEIMDVELPPAETPDRKSVV